MSKFCASALAAGIALVSANCTGQGGRIGYRDIPTLAQQVETRTEEPVFENRPFDPDKIATDPATGFPIVSDEILLTFKPGTTAEEARAIVESVGGKLVGMNSILNVYEVELPTGLTPHEAQEKLASQPAVEQALPNGIAKSDQTDPQSTCGWPDGFPNDPVFKDCDTKNDWGYTKIDAAPAWKTTAATTDVIIAILDTGVDGSHPEFQGRMLPGRDFIYGGTDTTDRYGHGTHVAGIAAARGNNEKGMAGGCWDCKILPVKVLGDGGSGTWMGVLNGITWAAQQGADVLNMSLGGGRTESLYQMIENAIAEARKAGALSVVAAGNSGGDASYGLPAAAPSAITVAATASSDQRAWFSSYGSVVDLAAPGVDIWAPVPNTSVLDKYCSPSGPSGEKYCYLSGTSMATPMVAGAIGCILSRGAAIDPDDAESVIKATADPIRTDKPLGAGRLNLGKACVPGGNKPPKVALSADPTSVKPLGVSTLTANASDPDGDPLSYTWSATGGTLAGSGSSVTWSAPEKVGAYTITAKVTDTHFTVPASVTISVKTGEVYSLVIMPGILPDMIKGQTYPLGWRIQDEIGQTLNESPTWSVAQGVGSITAGGLFTAENPGEGQIVAEFKGAVTNAKVKVINRLPTCYASALPLKGHVPFEVQFAGSAVDPDGSIPTGAWTFGDGGTASGMAAKHTYTAAGNLSATFTATDAHGGNCTKILPIVAEPPNKAPTCKALAAPATGKAPLNVQFSSGAQDSDGTVASILWTFHNGSTQTLSQAGFLYASAGTYGVSLAVKDDDGATCVDQTSVIVLPPNKPPTVIANANPSFGDEPLPVVLSATAWDPDGKIVSTAWKTGDGGTSSQTSFTYTYKQDGAYTATVTVTDDDGATASASASINVKKVIRPPTCTASADWVQGKAPLTVNFTAQAKDTDGSITQTTWTFGDGTLSNNASTSHVYGKAGTFSAVFKSTDNDGASCDSTTKIEVRPPNQPPTLSITATPTVGDEPLTVQFASNAKDSDGTVVSYEWSFGDGPSSSSSNPSHLYADDGKYTASLTVKDDDGAMASGSVLITVKRVILPISCSVKASPDWGSAPLTVGFSPVLNDPNDETPSYLWDLGDGTTSTSPALTHAYSNQGTFQAKLTVSHCMEGGKCPKSPTSGESHTCAATEEGLALCWGANGYGQLGDGTTASQDAPVEVCSTNGCASKLSDVVAVAAGDYHTCALLEGGKVRCWGTTWSGELGNGTYFSSKNQTTPVAVCADSTCSAELIGAAALDAGQAHTCALMADQTVKCWGAGSYGKLGHGKNYIATTPVSVCAGPNCTGPLTNVRKVAAGLTHTCALLTDGTVKCWGDNRFGGLGDGTTTDTNIPVSVCADASCALPLDDVIDVDAGGWFTCAATSRGKVKCWGLDDIGQLGIGTLGTGSFYSRLTPVSVCAAGGCAAELTGAVSIRTGFGHACAQLSDGTLKCWGDNNHGEVGDGTWGDFQGNKTLPVDVCSDPTCKEPLSGVEKISLGSWHTCAIVSHGTLLCWGGNWFGQLGNGIFDPEPLGENIPTRVCADTTCASHLDCAKSCQSCNGLVQVDVHASRPPVCSATATPVVGPVPLSVAFGAQATDPEGQPVSFNWSFGDGGVGTAQNPTHVYTSTGVFTAKLTATDPQGATCTKEISITANPNKPPACSASVTPGKGPAPLQVQFSGAASDLDGTIVSTSWSFGNGGTSTSLDPSVTFTQAGTYYPTFTAKDSSGATCSKQVTVKVDAKPVCAASRTPSQGRVPLTVSFGGSATDSDGSIASTAWTFGDGYTAGQGFTSHIFSTVGRFTSTFTASDNEGYTCAQSLTVNVLPPNKPPTCAASASPVKAHVPGNIQFYGTTSDSDGSVAQVFWTFGDGASSSSQNPSHLYTAQGSFEAKLSATDNEGATCTTTQSIVIEPPNKPPTVSIVAAPPKGPEPLNVAFTATTSDSDGQVVGYAWSFGDGALSTVAAPQHLYAQDGTYTATLTVTDDDGATASASTTVIVEKVLLAPICSVSATPLKGHQPLRVNFTGTATDADGSVQSTTWKFGDGSQNSGSNVSHTYSTQGSYTATFSAADNDGVSCSAQASIIVEPPNKPPIAVLSAEPKAGFVPLPVSFSGAGSSDSDGSIVSFDWDFGDGTQGIGPTPAHLFKVWGDFEVKLTVTDDDGAKGTATVWIEVWEGDTGSADAWPMFGAKGAHDNFSPARLPAKLDVLPPIWPSGSGGIGGQELNIPVLSPAISDGLLYTTTPDRLHTFDALTGKALWSLPVPYATDDPTPAIGEGVIVFTTGNELYAYEVATGRRLWGPKSLDLCSDSTSPAISDGLVAVIDCQSYIRVFDLHTGTALLNALVWGGQVSTPSGSPTIYKGKIWTATPAPGTGYTYLIRWSASPPAYEAYTGVAGIVQSAPTAKYNNLFVGDLSGRLSAIDIGTGVRRWSFMAGHSISTTPAVVRGKVIFGSWDHKVYALDAFTGKLLWSALTDGEIRSNVAVTPDYAVAVSRPGTVYRFKLTDGSLIDSTALGVETWASPALAHGMIYVGATDGKIYVLGDSSKLQSLTRTWTSLGADGGHTGSAPTLGPTSGGEKFVFRSGGGVNGSAVLNDQGDLHFGTASGTFYALQRDGTVKWAYQTGLMRGSAAMDGWGNVIAASEGGVVHKIDPTGALLWKYWVANTIPSTPCVGPDGSVYVGDTGGKFFGLSADGALKFKATLGDAMRNACATDAAGNIYVGGGDNRLRKFSASGALLFERGFTAPVLTTPTVADDGTVYVSTTNGFTFALSSGGGLLWYVSVSGTASVDSNNVYIQSAGGLDVFTRSGASLWSFNPGGGCSNPVAESPVVDTEGNVFFKHRGNGCTGGATIYGVSPSGQLSWSASVPGGSNSSPSLGRGRALYLGSGLGLHIFGQN